MPLSTKFSIEFLATLTAVQTLFTQSVRPQLSKTWDFEDGTLINTANRIYVDRLTLSSTPTDLDLAGALTNPLGSAVTFAKINGLIVINNSTTAAEIVTVGADGSAAVAALFGDASDGIKVGPNGALLLVNPSLAGYAVTATTADILQLVAASGTPTVDIAIIGRSA